jgi:RNA polymerase sigma factor (sigma-70 family)
MVLAHPHATGQAGSRLPGAADGPSDAQLLRQFTRRRDPAAFEALVYRHGPMVLRVCRRVLGDTDGAEDACQSAFLLLLRRAHALAQPDRLAGWLYGVALRVAGNVRAQAAARWAREQGTTPPATPDPPAEAARRELAALLAAELGRLPEKYRAPLVLCYLEGLTNHEAARQLGWPPGSMSRRLNRGRKLLRDRLARRAPEFAV